MRLIHFGVPLGGLCNDGLDCLLGLGMPEKVISPKWLDFTKLSVEVSRFCPAVAVLSARLCVNK